ncbi:MAG: acyltransferase [Bacteroidota bacterium]
MKKPKIYFPNLNGLRFIAAFLVLIYHLEQLKATFGLESYWDSVPFYAIIGKLGVILFFVLSGFLITFLLLVEEQNFDSINVKNFYIRRILRIWPLYLFIIVLALLLLPQCSTFTEYSYGREFSQFNYEWVIISILYLLFLPNLVLAVFGLIPYASHTWSIGTEEQFYLFWPLLLRYIKKNRARFMVLIVLFYVTVNLFLSTSYSDFIPLVNMIRAFWKTIPFDCMAIGGLYAIMLFRKNKMLDFILRNDVFYSTIIVVCILLLNGVYIPYLHYEIYSFLFGLIIINFAANKKSHISLENRFLNYLGKISYGLYMYHPIGIVLALQLCLSTGVHSNYVIYPLSTIVTTIIAALSYKYFETYFLQFKDRFSSIISGGLRD